MKIETLEEKIKARAKSEISQAWSVMEREVRASIKKFSGACLDYSDGYTQAGKDVLMRLAGGSNKIDGSVWRHRENAIRDEILTTMDTLQRTLMVKDGPLALEEGDAGEEEK